MVQFKVTKEELRRAALRGHNEYWKSGVPYKRSGASIKRELSAAKVYFKSSAKRDRLHELVARYERGLLSYDTCSTDELRKFCLQRQLVCASRPKKDDLVQGLEEADEMATFNRFLDLPPELRNRIYSLHFQTFEPLGRPTSPPITRTSRQLREETFLLFWQSCTLRIENFVRSFWPHTGLFESFIEADIPIWSNHDALRTFSRLPEEYLGNIRKVRLVGAVSAPKPSMEWIYAEWHIDLGLHGDQVRMSVGEARCRPRDIPHGFDEERDKLEALLKAKFETIMAREGNNKLHREDLGALKGIFESNY